MKVPPNAKKVFQGVIFSVYQWEQKMFDGSFETFEMLQRPHTVEVIATSGETIFLSQQSQPQKENYYALFGGRGDKGEEPLVTAKRELAEESGLVSSDWELMKIYNPIAKIDWQIYLYVARDCIMTGKKKLDAGEKISTISCQFDEFLDIVTSDRYWGQELTTDILRMKQDKKVLKAFEKKLFLEK